MSGIVYIKIKMMMISMIPNQTKERRKKKMKMNLWRTLLKMHKTKRVTKKDTMTPNQRKAARGRQKTTHAYRYTSKVKLMISRQV